MSKSSLFAGNVEALRESENKYRTLMEQASDGIHTYDLEGNFIDANSKLCEMLGYTREELLRFKVRDLIPASDLACAPLRFEELRAGKTIISERRLRRKDGLLLPVEISGKMLPNGLLQAIVRDTTERKQAEEAVRFHSHLLNTVEQAVIATDLNGRIIYWNSFAEKLYGWPATEIIGCNVNEVTPSQDAEDQASEIMSRLQAGQSWSGELTVRRRDRTTFPAFITDTPIYNDEGMMIGIVGVSGDMTERKRAEERLRESEERHRAIVNQAMMGVAHCDLSGNFTFVNQKYCDITGYSESELLEMRMQEITHSDDVLHHVKLFERMVAGGAPFEIEERYTRRDGSIIWVLIGASTIRDREGKPQSAIAAVADITERKRTQMLLDAQKQSLEMVVSGAPLTEVLTYMTRVVEQQAEGRAVASILLLDKQGSLHNGASPSLPEDYIKAIDGIKADPDVGTCSAAAARGTVVITPDIATDPKWQNLKHLPVGLGLQAAWTMPIMARDGSVLGTFGTYFRERREPEALEQQAVEILAHTAALAIERTRAEEALRESEEWLRTIFESSSDGILVENEERIVYVNKSYRHLLGYDEPEELIGKHVSIVISPEDSDSMLEFGRRRVRGELPASVYEFKGTRKDGGLVEVEASVSTSTVAGRTYITTMVRPIADRKQAEEALRRAHDELERRVDERTLELAKANEVLRAEVAERKRTEETLLESEHRLKMALQTSKMGSWELDLVTETLTSSPTYKANFGWPPDADLSYKVLFEAVHPDDRARVREAVKLAIQAHRDYEAEYRNIWPDGSIHWIIARGRGIYETDGKPVRMVGVTLDITERRQAEETRKNLLRRLVTTQEEERHRIARELHDQMGQGLAALTMNFKSLKAACQCPPPAHDHHLQLQELTDQLSREVRTLAWELRPPALDDLGLHSALSQYVEEWSERSKILVDFQSIGLDRHRLPLEVETTLYRIVQEALTNVIKHAQADNVCLILNRRRDHVLTIIEDNGRGFDGQALKDTPFEGRRLGLLGMRERAALIKGELNIESAPGRGTTLFVRIPISQSEHA